MVKPNLMDRKKG